MYQDASKRLELALEAAALGTWDWDVDADAAVWDARNYALHGVAGSQQSVTFELWISGIHPEDREATRAATQAALDGGDRFETRYRVTWPDGSVHVIEGLGIVVRGEDGRVQRMIGVNRDVTEPERLLEAVETSRRRLHSIIEASPVAYALNDDAQNITYLNRAFVDLFGYTRDDIPTLEQWWPRAYPDEAYRKHVIEEWGRRLDRSQQEGIPFESMELTIRAKDGRDVIATAYARPLADAGQHDHLVILCDITELRRAETERHTLEEQLHHAQRLESVGRLAGGVAHDNNNFLGAIMGNLDLAMDEAEGNPTQLEHLREALVAAERAAAVTRQVLTYARRQPIEPRSVVLGSEVERGLRLLKPALGPEMRTEVDCEPGAWSVFIDPTQVHQILMNLCLNARDATSGRGTLRITVVNAPAGESDANAPGDHVCLAVHDDGPGMDEAVRIRAFEPFFTTKAQGQGTGLGLSTVHGIAHQNGGAVEIESAPGAGTTVRVLLPRHAARDHDSGPVARPEVHRGKTRTVLVVDDERMMLRLLTRLIPKLGYQVLSASSADEAEELAAHYEGEIDLLLTDVAMPGRSGLELAEALSRARPGIRSLLMSGHAAETFEGLLDGKQTLPLLPKPFSRQTLAHKMRELLGDEEG